jgi:integrase
MAIRERTWESGGKTRKAWIVDYHDADRVRRQKSFRTKKEADAWWTDEAPKVRAGTHTPDSTSITVFDAGQAWLDQCRNHNLERSTIRQYEQHLNQHIKPFLGSVKLSRLTAPMVQKFADDLLKEGRSVAMARKVVTSLGSLIAEAQRQGRVAQNVARGVRFPKLRRKRTRTDIPTIEEINALINGAKGRWRPFFITAIFTGLRASELRALMWENVDFEGQRVTVSQRADRWNDIGEPKSEAGHRDVPMSPLVTNTLKEWKLACPRGELGLVFPNGKGRVENLGNIYSRGFVPLQKQCGIINVAGKPKYGIHALRHAAASMFIQHAGFSPKKVQTVMGHSSIQMTYDVYGHLFPTPEDDVAAMAAVEAAVLA